MIENYIYKLLKCQMTYSQTILRSTLFLICFVSPMIGAAQSDDDLPDYHSIDVRYESENFCGLNISTEWSGGAHLEADLFYRIVDLNGGGFVAPSTLIQQNKSDQLLKLLNLKLALYVQEMEQWENASDYSDIIETLKESSVEIQHLDWIKFSNRNWNGENSPLEATLTCGFLYYAAQALEPYLKLTEKECRYFFTTDFFSWQDIE